MSNSRRCMYVYVCFNFNLHRPCLPLISPISGSLESEACIYALSYDNSGSRLVTCEADKTIKMWKEDLTATPETHPINFKPPKDIRRYWFSQGASYRIVVDVLIMPNWLVCLIQFKFGHTFSNARYWGMDDQSKISVPVQVDMRQV